MLVVRFLGRVGRVWAAETKRDVNEPGLPSQREAEDQPTLLEVVAQGVSLGAAAIPATT